MLAILILGVLLHQSIANVQTHKVFYDVDNLEHVNSLFEQFIITHEKRYTGEEKTKRFNVFRDTLQEINQLNHDHPDTVFGITHSADLTAEELVERNGVITPEQLADNADCQSLGDNVIHDFGDAYWLSMNIVQDQKDCSSVGWAYSVTALMDYMSNMQSNTFYDLSPQQLIDCIGGLQACSTPQTPAVVFTKLMKQGQMLLSDYPIEDKPGTCKFDSTKVQATVSKCITYNVSSEESLRKYLTLQGPMTVLIDASSRAFQSYRYGIFDDCRFNSTRLTHGVQVIGYSTLDPDDGYWIVRNSYGLKWGELGNINLKSGYNCLGLVNPSAALAFVKLVN